MLFNAMVQRLLYNGLWTVTQKNLMSKSSIGLEMSFAIASMRTLNGPTVPADNVKYFHAHESPVILPHDFVEMLIDQC